MNGFLVIARFHSDDVPLGFFKSSPNAAAFGRKISEAECRRIGEELFKCDIGSELICVVAVHFVDGKPKTTYNISNREAAELGEAGA